MGFALAFVVALAVTGFIWAVDAVVTAPARRRRVETLQANGQPGEAERAAREPLLVEYAKSFFPVILVVLILRSFVVEPFRIPSGSMIPTLKVGDFILVNKSAYGLRLPVINKEILKTGLPHRGDVMVFRFPPDPSQDFIKRVVGLPGDRIIYRDKRLYINGKLVPQSQGHHVLYHASASHYVDARQYQETLGGVSHAILELPGAGDQPTQSFVVPAHEYFVMGDNRDESYDSRYWGYVPEQNLVGHAFLIWFSWDVADGKSVDWRRIGRLIH